jgi:AcrR family transcriptional regulator
VLKTVSRSEQQESAQSTAFPRLQQRKQALVRDTIWEAAIDLFAEKGFDETTVDDIAEAAGTSRRSFFRYFESKSDLMAHGIVSYGSSLTDAIRKCPLAHSAPELLRHTVLTVARESASHPRTRKIMDIAAKYPAAREAQIARVAEVQDQVAKAFAERHKKGSKDQTTARVLAALTLSVLSVTYQTWFESGQIDIAVTVEQVLGTLCDLACAATKSAHKKAAKKPGPRR